MEKETNAGTETTVKFTVPAFRYKGVEYKSAQVEKAAEAGDENALAIVANLVKIGSGIVEIVEVEASDAPPAPKKSKKKGGTNE